MKKLFAAIVVILSIIFVFAACNRAASKPSLADNVTFMQTDFFVGATQNFSVEISIGVKEKIFIADGKIGERAAFTEINVIPLKADLSGEYTFSLSAGDTVINGTLSENIFGNCLTSNIDLTAVKGSIGNITITRGEVSEIVTLENKLKDLLSWKDALNIAEKEFKDRIESEKTDGVLPREIYVKFVRDTKTQDSPYFWYVSFIGENNSFWALLLDPANGNVLTKK